MRPYRWSCARSLAAQSRRRVKKSDGATRERNPADLEVGEAGLPDPREDDTSRLRELALVLAADGEDAVEVRLGGHELEDAAEQLLLDAAGGRVVDRRAAWARSYGLSGRGSCEAMSTTNSMLFERRRQRRDDGGVELLAREVARRRQRLLPLDVLLVDHAVLHVRGG